MLNKIITIREHKLVSTIHHSGQLTTPKATNLSTDNNKMFNNNLCKRVNQFLVANQ